MHSLLHLCPEHLYPYLILYILRFFNGDYLLKSLWNFVTIFDGLYSFDHPLDPEEGMKEREGGTEGNEEERILIDT